MRILFIHNTFPGRLGALARYLAAAGHEVLFAASYGRRDVVLPGVQRVVLKVRDSAVGANRGLVSLWKRTLSAGEQVLAPLRLLAADFRPDMVLSTHAEGIAFFIRQAMPEAFHVFYLTRGGVPGAEAQAMASLCRLRVLESDCCVAFSRAEMRVLPTALRSRVRLATPWVETELFTPGLAKPFLPDRLAAGAELVSVDMRGLDEAQEHAVRRLVVELLTLRPCCHVLLDCGEDGAGRLWARRLSAKLRGRLHTAEFLPLAARRDMLCASSLYLCPNEAGLFPGRLEAMSCAVLLMSPLLREDGAILRACVNMLPFPEAGLQKRLAAVLHALDHARDYGPLRARARETVLEAFTPQAVLPGHAALLMEAYAAHRAGEALPGKRCFQKDGECAAGEGLDAFKRHGEF